VLLPVGVNFPVPATAGSRFVRQWIRGTCTSWQARKQPAENGGV